MGHLIKSKIMRNVRVELTAFLVNNIFLLLTFDLFHEIIKY